MIYKIEIDTEAKKVKVFSGTESLGKLEGADYKEDLTEQMIKAQVLIEIDIFNRSIKVDNTQFKKDYDKEIKEITHQE